MKKLILLLLTLALCAALAVPAFAQEGYGALTITDGSTSITFAEGKSARKAILLARRNWAPGAGAAETSAAERVEVNLITAKKGSTVTRVSTSGATYISFLVKQGSGYVMMPDTVAFYASSFVADRLFDYPFVQADICRLTLGDGSEYYVISGATALTEAPPVPVAYTVAPGDTEESIALNWYGASGLGAALKAANPEHYAASGGALEAGRELTLPVQLSGRTRLTEPLLKEGEQLYVIKSGDTLSAVALKIYGHAEYYSYIVARNAGRFNDATVLRVGDVIILPVISG